MINLSVINNLMCEVEDTTINPIIRQFKIDMITDTPNPIIDWFNELWYSLTVVELEVFYSDSGEFVYYKTDGNIKIVVFFLDTNHKNLWCDFDHYWSFLLSQEDIKFYIPEISTVLFENVFIDSLSFSVVKPFISTSIIASMLAEKIQSIK